MSKYKFTQPISKQIWEDKYKYTPLNGKQGDDTVEDMWHRVAKAASESTHKSRANKGIFYDTGITDTYYTLLEDFKFIPAGRILAGAGTGRKVTLSNCYVMGKIPDSIEGIFESVKKGALTMQQGGGIGNDFSTIRPSGAVVKKLDAIASGPLSFMDVWDSMCRTIMSAGSRRGAMMATMRCDHPDIMQFIKAKRDPLKLRMFNVSVLVTDAFIDAVKNDDSWNLVHEAEPAIDNGLGTDFEGKYIYEVVSAKELWDTIMDSTYNYAEPGVLFVDTINRRNNAYFDETVSCTNPCVAGDTPILTEEGWKDIDKCLDNPISVWNGHRWSTVTPRITGYNQPMVTVKLSDGSSLRCTEAHKFILKDSSRVQAKGLVVGAKLEKSIWPVITNKDTSSLDYYAQGFFSGDGWEAHSTGLQYIGLYGDKENIKHDWNPVTSRDYPISGGYPGTDTSQTKIYLRYDKGHFKPKNYIPFNASLTHRKEWLAGLCDSDGTATKDGCIQITAKDRDFLLGVKALINTMGTNATLSPMKEFWRLSISATNVDLLSFSTKRLQQVKASRDASRFITVTSIEPSGVESIVYCYTDEHNNSGVFNGVYTAQCGEQPMGPWGACLLGAMNLTKYVKSPFIHDQADFDFASFRKDVDIAVRMLDSFIDISGYPVPEQQEEALYKRRIGLGKTGLASMFLMMNIKYGDNTSTAYETQIMESMKIQAYKTSIELAKELGCNGLTDTIEKRKLFLEGEFVKEFFTEEMKNDVMKYGIRNSHLLTVAPTGTTSIIAGNVSSGIEPIFAPSYTRKVLQADGSYESQLVEDYAVKAYREYLTEQNLPNVPHPAMVTAQDLSPDDHLKMLFTAQKHVDSAISKTINLPEDISKEDFAHVYMTAYENGCKGCTTYRPNAVTGSVLSVDEPKKEEEVKPSPERPVPSTDVLEGLTYSFKWFDDNVHVTINDIELSDGVFAPYEVFINSKVAKNYTATTSIAVLISKYLQKDLGRNLTDLISSLKTIADPNGGTFTPKGFVPSLTAYIGRTLEAHTNRFETIYETEECTTCIPEPVEEESTNDPCTSCGSYNVAFKEGCYTCLDCNSGGCG